MKKLFLLIALLSIRLSAFSQDKHDYVWVFGYGSNNPTHFFGGTILDFNFDPVKATFFELPPDYGFNIPCSISDGEGRLQFYANGCKIMNYENREIENGDSISPGLFHHYECDFDIHGYDAYQEMMILPRPGKPGRYVYFHPTIEEDVASGKLLYSEVDMNLNGGEGKVIRKNVLLRGPTNPSEGAMAAVRHGNGRDWWLVIQYSRKDIYSTFLITPDTIWGPMVQDWENSITEDSAKANWNMVISPDGTRMAHTMYRSPVQNFIILYDFDRCSGRLCNPKKILMPPGDGYATWVAFSPNSRYLYLQIEQRRLYQYDLWAEDIEASVQLIGEYDGFRTDLGFPTLFHSMAIGPDGKIYICSSNSIYYYHTIHHPNEPGALCDFRQHDLQLPTVCTIVMPNYPNFRLYDVPGSYCDTLGIDSPYPSAAEQERHFDIRIAPNPADDMVNVYLGTPSSPGQLRVFDSAGRLVIDQPISGAIATTCFPVKQLPAGVYVLQIAQEALGVWAEKFVVAHGER